MSLEVVGKAAVGDFEYSVDRSEYSVGHSNNPVKRFHDPVIFSRIPWAIPEKNVGCSGRTEWTIQRMLGGCDIGGVQR